MKLTQRLRAMLKSYLCLTYTNRYLMEQNSLKKIKMMGANMQLS